MFSGMPSGMTDARGDLQQGMETQLKDGAPRMDARQEEERAHTEEFAHHRQRLEQRLGACVEEGDYKSAADLQAELKALLEARAHTEELEQHRQGLERRLAACVKEGDFKNAAAILEQLKSPLKVAAPRLGTSRMERGTRGEECERERGSS